MKRKILLSLVVVVSLQAQNLKNVITEVLQTNPVIQEKLKNYNATKEDITSAQAGYYPSIDLNLGFGLEKTKKTNIPSGANKSDSFNVYQNSLKYTQNLFNGFNTTYQVQEQEYKTISAAYSYIETVNDRAFAMVSAYLQLMKNYELLETAQANVKIDTEIFNKVQKLYDAGLTTLSEVNKIESSLALAKSNLVVQENTILDETFKLKTILGREINPQLMEKPTLDVHLPDTKEEAALFAIKNNPSLLISDYNIKLAQATYKASKSSFYPKVDIEISQAMNKNLSAIEGNEDKFRAMAFVSYNIFNGFSDTAAKQKSISQIHQQIENKNNLRRQTIEGLNLSFAANQKLAEQLQHLEDYKKYSLKTLTLYSKEYDLGRRSLLDLLSAQNDFIGSKAQIITTKYSLLLAKYRILDAMGTLVSTIMGEENHTYNMVGLSGKTPQNTDTLPVNYDRDKDLVVNEMDLCDNSLASQMKDEKGCLLQDSTIAQIERYSEFLFEETSLESNEKLQNLIKQLKPYGVEKIKFTLLGNAYSDNLSDKDLDKLALKRTTVIKEALIKAGFSEDNITQISNANQAPLYSDLQDKRNNRVDIVVIKLK